MAPYKGLKVVTYHRSWPNFTGAFGLDVIGYVEPKPGIPPSPSHTLELIQEMKRQQVKIIIMEPYFDSKTPDAIAATRALAWSCWRRRSAVRKRPPTTSSCSTTT